MWRSVFYPFREELRTSPTHLSVPIYQNFPTVGYEQLMPRAHAYIYPWFITAYQLFAIAFLVSPSDYLQVRCWDFSTVANKSHRIRNRLERGIVIWTARFAAAST